MKHVVHLTQGEYPDYPEGTRTVHHAYCTTCLWYREGENLASLETATKNHINENRLKGYPETPPPIKKSRRTNNDLPLPTLGTHTSRNLADPAYQI